MALGEGWARIRVRAGDQAATTILADDLQVLLEFNMTVGVTLTAIAFQEMVSPRVTVDHIERLETRPEHAHEVGRCQLDPSLKATCFQPLKLRVHTVLST